jgi:hypothetical protein
VNVRIHFERTGGVAGVRLLSEIRSDALPRDEQQRLEQLVADSGFFNLRDGGDDGTSADRFEYAITIDAGSGAHAVRMSEAALPPRMRPLIRWLIRAAGTTRP